MAEVLPPIAQQSASIAMLHSPDPFQKPSPSQSHPSSPRLPQMSRAHVVYNGQNATASMTGKRGPTATPVAPYAFQSTPQLRQENRASSAPGVNQVAANVNNERRSEQSNASSISTDTSTTSTSSSKSDKASAATSKDDSALSTDSQKNLTADARPMTAISLTSPALDLTLSLPSFAFESSSKSSPNRYRRTQGRTDSSSQSPLLSPNSEATISPNTIAAELSSSALTTSENDAGVSHSRTSSTDDTARFGNSESAKRYRRRSPGSLDSAASASPMTSPIPGPSGTPPVFSSPPATEPLSLNPAVPITTRPTSSHSKNPPQIQRFESYASVAARGIPDKLAQAPSSSTTLVRPSSSRSESDRRSSSPLRTSDHSKRRVNPSPLSRPVQQDENAATKSSKLKSVDNYGDANGPPSPAAQHLAALSEKDMNKGMKSRLRRAFSFGSAQELRKASAQNTVERERAKLHKLQSEDDVLAAEDAAVVAKQEAAGLGNSIYSQGQGGMYGGSMDNLSIASTASSASMMLRKLGAGAKKSARSVKGLFRPKSVIGVPAADAPIAAQPSTAAVSMVTVEAERERVNVNADPHDRVGGGTGFPHLERNSIDAASATGSMAAMIAADIRSRKSIIASDGDRDEVLRAVRKGILKRTGTGLGSAASSPVILATETSFDLPAVRNALESPRASGASTPTGEDPSASDSPRASSFYSRNDYFGNSSRFMTGSTRSLPSSPEGPRNISFNTRIQFHDAWSATEYDRRGDIATCNRLTPMLAQQIKEELNTFKMEMEVHELSKLHTHFF